MKREPMNTAGRMRRDPNTTRETIKGRMKMEFPEAWTHLEDTIRTQ